MTKRKWTRQRVIRAILDRHRSGMALEKTWKEDPSLYEAAKNRFGSWHRALGALDLPSNPHRRWTKQLVVEALRAWRRQDRSLTTVWKADRGLYAAAVKFFGSWENAKVAMGLPRSHRQQWSRQGVIDAIRGRHRRGLPITGVRKHDASLHSAAGRYFGGWKKALVAAGLQPHQTTWSRQLIIETIQARDRQGKGVGTTSRDDLLLRRAAHRHFGSWRDAMLAAGLEPAPRRNWSKPLLIQEIREWFRREPPTGSIWGERRELHAAAVRYFGSWDKALLAAGIEYQKRTWSAELVLVELHSRYRHMKAGISIEDKGLAVAAKKYFGSCHNAVLAAGLELRPRKWSRQRVITAIQDRYVKALPLISSGGRQDTALVSAAKIWFGRWHDALVAAGVPAPSPRTRWSPQRVVDEIHARRRRGLALIKIWRHDQRLAGAARRHFGDWNRAMEAAGLSSEIPREWTRQSLIEELQSRHQQGLPLTWEQNPAITYPARKHFGTWSNALLAAGLKPHRKRWSRQIVIDEIRARSQQGLSLSSGWSGNQTLVAAAIHYCGSWRKALHAARVSPPNGKKTHHK